jgi:hypothetical protein
MILLTTHCHPVRMNCSHSHAKMTIRPRANLLGARRYSASNDGKLAAKVEQVKSNISIRPSERKPEVSCAENLRWMKKEIDELNKKIKEDPSIIEEIKISPESWKEIIDQMEKSKNDYYYG